MLFLHNFCLTNTQVELRDGTWKEIDRIEKEIKSVTQEFLDNEKAKQTEKANGDISAAVNGTNSTTINAEKVLVFLLF